MKLSKGLSDNLKSEHKRTTNRTTMSLAADIALARLTHCCLETPRRVIGKQWKAIKGNWQTVETQIRRRMNAASDQGLLCL